MKNKLFIYFQINIITFIVAIALIKILFNSSFIEPDYYACTQIKFMEFSIFENSFFLNYPISCDQNEYLLGFNNFNYIINNEYSYQQRPIYIFSVFFINNMFSPLYSLFNFNEFFSIIFSIIIVHIFVLNAGLMMILELTDVKKISLKDKIFVVVINTLHPMAKWGLFEPSNQMLTLLQLVFPIYMIKKNRNISFFWWGLLFLYNRTFLVSFLIYFILKIIRDKKFKPRYFFEILLFIMPFFIYKFYFFINDINSFDTNTETYQQFTWIIDYFTGGNRKYGEYFCHRIPGFISCYLDRTIDLLTYLSIPFIVSIFVLYFNFRNENKLIKQLLISFSIFYIFWSLIGWYPLRFIYYSLGNLINFLLIYGYFKVNRNVLEKTFYSIPLVFYFLFLTMWNNPESNAFIASQVVYLSGALFVLYIYIRRKNKSNFIV